MKFVSSNYNVGYPVYGAKFLNHRMLLVAGGGGEGNNGISNKLTVLRVDFEKKKVIKRFREITLDPNDDSPTTLDAAHDIVLMGCNENSAKIKSGEGNHHLRKFAYENEHLRFVASVDFDGSTLPEDYTKLIYMSRDGTVSAIASSKIPTVIRIIDPRDLTEKYEIETGHDVKDMHFAPDGKVISYITASTLEVISIVTGRFIIRKTDFDKNYNLSKIRFLTDDVVLIAASLKKGSGIVMIKISLKSGSASVLKTKLITNKFKGVTSMDVDAKNQLAVIAGNDNSIALVKLKDFSIGRMFKQVHNFAITRVTFSPDSKLVASVSAANTVNIIRIPDNFALSSSIAKKLRKFFINFVMIVLLAAFCQLSYKYDLHGKAFTFLRDQYVARRSKSAPGIDVLKQTTLVGDIVSEQTFTKPFFTEKSSIVTSAFRSNEGTLTNTNIPKFDDLWSSELISTDAYDSKDATVHLSQSTQDRTISYPTSGSEPTETSKGPDASLPSFDNIASQSLTEARNTWGAETPKVATSPFADPSLTHTKATDSTGSTSLSDSKTEQNESNKVAPNTSIPTHSSNEVVIENSHNKRTAEATDIPLSFAISTTEETVSHPLDLQSSQIGGKFDISPGIAITSSSSSSENGESSNFSYKEENFDQTSLLTTSVSLDLISSSQSNSASIVSSPSKESLDRTTETEALDQASDVPSQTTQEVVGTPNPSDRSLPDAQLTASSDTASFLVNHSHSEATPSSKPEDEAAVETDSLFQTKSASNSPATTITQASQTGIPSEVHSVVEAVASAETSAVSSPNGPGITSLQPEMAYDSPEEKTPEAFEEAPAEQELTTPTNSLVSKNFTSETLIVAPFESVSLETGGKDEALPSDNKAESDVESIDDEVTKVSTTEFEIHVQVPLTTMLSAGNENHASQHHPTTIKTGASNGNTLIEESTEESTEFGLEEGEHQDERISALTTSSVSFYSQQRGDSTHTSESTPSDDGIVPSTPHSHVADENALSDDKEDRVHDEL